MTLKYFITFFIGEAILIGVFPDNMDVVNTLLTFGIRFWVANIEEKRGSSND